MLQQYKGVSKNLRIGILELELQMVQLSATRCSCIAILWVSLTSFAAITICVASQRVFIVVSVYFVIDTVRNLLDTNSMLSLAYSYIHADNFHDFMQAGAPAYFGSKIPVFLNDTFPGSVI
jgi:hypothetical protein